MRISIEIFVVKEKFVTIDVRKLNLQKFINETKILLCIFGSTSFLSLVLYL